ncbi:Aldolase-type TIM barrel family protein [Hibiscus syriacus]|uniref:Aldolase-type TIM barrel family protein n=1 Tax=Hibiscus syriacus TaxID=106335 RepID=A0A6A3ADA2_HIBSY|nr:Aldolase-type TIM barrel family protein [Hibiscus syriacus]
MAIALILACSSLAAIISSLFCLWVYYSKNSRKSTRNDGKSSYAEKGVGLTPFFGKFKPTMIVSKENNASFMDYKVVEKSTDKFHQGNILGEDGFGCFYKAQFDDGSFATVKKLDRKNQDAEKEFHNEVDLLRKFKHPNIISLLVFSSESESRFIVYELMQNSSLETQIHGLSQGSSLTWDRMMKIALDTTSSLSFHFVSIQLSDFGLVVTDAAHNKNNLKLSGTLGKLIDKSDVYAFGVVLLELLLGRKPMEKLAPAQCQSIVTRLTDRSKLPDIVDPVIRNTMDLKHLYQVGKLLSLFIKLTATSHKSDWLWLGRNE